MALFGEKLKAIRIERKMSQEQLAELLGTSKQVISRYETNQRTPKITVAQEYAEKLNVERSYLIDDTVEIATDDFTESSLSDSVHNKKLTPVSEDGLDPELVALINRIPADRMPEVKRFLRFQVEQEEKP